MKLIFDRNARLKKLSAITKRKKIVQNNIGRQQQAERRAELNSSLNDHRQQKQQIEIKKILLLITLEFSFYSLVFHYRWG